MTTEGPQAGQGRVIMNDDINGKVLQYEIIGRVGNLPIARCGSSGVGEKQE